MQLVKATPRSGYTVFNPETDMALAGGGEWVELNNYWRRRFLDKEVYIDGWIDGEDNPGSGMDSKNYFGMRAYASLSDLMLQTAAEFGEMAWVTDDSSGKNGYYRFDRNKQWVKLDEQNFGDLYDYLGRAEQAKIDAEASAAAALSHGDIATQAADSAATAANVATGSAGTAVAAAGNASSFADTAGQAANSAALAAQKAEADVGKIEGFSNAAQVSSLAAGSAAQAAQGSAETAANLLNETEQAKQFVANAATNIENTISEMTAPKSVLSANLALDTGVYYTSGDVPSEEEYKVDVVLTATQIIQTATKGDGSVWTRSFDKGATLFPVWVGQSVVNLIDLPLVASNGTTRTVTNPISGGMFVYNAAKSNINDGGYIFNGWTRQTTILNLNHFNGQLAQMLRAAIANGLPVVDYSGAIVNLAEVTTVVVDKDLRIDTNITLTGQPLYLQGIISTPTNITAAVAKGSRSITVANAADIRVGDTLLLRKNYDYSLCEFSKVNSKRPYYKDGEAVTVTAIAGNVLTLDRPLKVQYLGANTDEVSAMRSGAVTINGLNTDTSGIFGIGLRLLTKLNFDLNSIVTNHIEADSALWIERCVNVRGKFKIVSNNATNIKGSNYGVSIANSQDVYVEGGLAHGLRHGVSTGGSETQGGIPCRNIIVKVKDITNVRSVGQQAADFHGNTIDSYYIDCTVHGPIAIGGKNVGFVGGSFEGQTTIVGHNLSEWWGGEQRIENCVVTVRAGYDASKAFSAFAATNLIYGIKEDVTFVSKNVTYVWEAAGNPLSIITASYANADSSVSVVIENPTFIGFTKIDRPVFLNPVDTVYRKPRKVIMRNWDVMPTYDALVYGAATQLTEAKVEYPESWGNLAGGGRWIKRKDGSAEVYLTLTSALAIDVQNTINGYLSAEQIWNFPFAFISAPTIEVSTGATAAGAVVGSVTTALAKYQLRSGSSQTSTSHVIHLVARGLWV